MMVESTKQLNRGVLIGCVFLIVTVGAIYHVGALSNLFFLKTEGVVASEAVKDMDKIIPLFINKAMPEWFGAVFMLCILSASMSTLTTQANLDLYGVSEASAAARDAGGVLINGREMVDAQKWYQAIGSQSGLPQYYLYSATNVRLQELSLGYTLPTKWFRDKMRMTVSFVGRNLWMIYCKAPFDPEAVASTGLNYQGIDYFMMPSMRSLGFNVKFQF